MAESLYPLTLFIIGAQNSKLFVHSDFEMALSFAIIDSIAATTLQFINNVRTQENRNFTFK